VTLTDHPEAARPLAEPEAGRPEPELDIALAWTGGVNDAVADMEPGVPPFPWVRESQAALFGRADMIVVSATAVEALTRERQEHDIARYVRVVV
jgi:hypothetical protein